MLIADPDLAPVTAAAAAGALGLLLVLSIRCTALQSGGDGAHAGPGARRARQARDHCALHAPLALIGIALLEARLGGPLPTAAASGLVLALVLHAVGTSRLGPQSIPARAGTLGTWAVMAVSAAALLWQALAGAL